MELVLEIKIDYAMKRNLPLSTCAIVAALITSASATVTMDWVTVGDPGNAIDPLTGYGAVAYEYRIGKYEVTNAQYGQFLNAKGQSNSNNIYDPVMASYGITQSGNSGSFTYNVTGALANRPVVYVSWHDAARFANWMMNGQGNASMETGAYTLNNAIRGIITANIGAKVYLPTENEWYKAAYYNAVNQTYSLYPNGLNSISTLDANYGIGSTSSSDVGYYNHAPSSYGTYDQGGNVWEWSGLGYYAQDGKYFEQQRGGAWGGASSGYASFNNYYGIYIWDLISAGSEIRVTADPVENNKSGFRLAAVPEPTSILLSMLAGVMMLIRRKR